MLYSLLFFVAFSLGFLVIEILVAAAFLHLRFLIGLIIGKRGADITYVRANWLPLKQRKIVRIFLLLPVFVFLIAYTTLFLNAKVIEYSFKSSLGFADRVEVWDTGWCHRSPDRNRVVYATEDRAEIDALIDAVSFGVSVPGMGCLCCGEVSFDFFMDGEVFESISVHHRETLRIKDDRFGDYYLTPFSLNDLSDWLKSRKLYMLEDTSEINL